MITKQDLEAAIAECQGQREPDSRTCIMLAAFYTIRREMFGADPVKEPNPESYSFASAPEQNPIRIESGSDFAKAIDGREQSEILPILDELMDTLLYIQPRLYYAVMDKIL